MRLCLAAPLFTRAERDFNLRLSCLIGAGLPAASVVLPQDLCVEAVHCGDFAGVFRMCLEAVRACDVVVAVLDGPDCDSGTCVELGYAWALGKRIVGLRTDSRASEEHGLNIMVSRVCTVVLHFGRNDTVAEMARRVSLAVGGMG